MLCDKISESRLLDGVSTTECSKRINKQEDIGRVTIKEADAAEAGCSGTSHCYLYHPHTAQPCQPVAYVFYSTSFCYCWFPSTT